jgi:hypothetical protein
MTGWILMFLLSGRPIPGSDIILLSQTSCNDLGSSIVADVVSTIPDRGNKMSYSCREALMATNDGVTKP